MKRNKIHILSTGPVGKKLINLAAESNVEIEEISFIKAEICINDIVGKKISDLLDQSVTAIFTSSHAVDGLKKFIKEKPSWTIYCIGHSTKNRVAKIFGEDHIAGFADTADQLAEKIIKSQVNEKIYFFCGNQRRDELPVKLTSNHIETEELAIYKTIETPKALSKIYDGILFFSPSGVKSYFSRNFITNATLVFAIGNTTAETIKHFTQKPAIIAEIPGKENLVTLAIDYFSKNKTG